jgi:hypothetical protein
MSLVSKLAGALSAGLLAFTAAPSQAASYLISFLDDSSTYSVDAVITTLDVPNILGGYDVTSIAGTVTGFLGVEAITTLVPNPTPPGLTYCCGFNFDNVFYAPPAAPFDLGGILFSTASRNYNLYVAQGVARLGTYVAPQLTLQNLRDVSGALSVTAAPEPATWALMVLGFGSAGLAMRSRRRRLAV